MRVFYRRTGSWPTVDPASYEVTPAPPADGARVRWHGAVDRMPGPRMEWRVLDLPDEPLSGVHALAMALDLAPGAPADPGPRNAVLMGDAIALYRAICWLMMWPDALDASALLGMLPTPDAEAGAIIERACTMRAL